MSSALRSTRGARGDGPGERSCAACARLSCASLSQSPTYCLFCCGSRGAFRPESRSICCARSESSAEGTCSALAPPPGDAAGLCGANWLSTSISCCSLSSSASLSCAAAKRSESAPALLGRCSEDAALRPSSAAVLGRSGTRAAEAEAAEAEAAGCRAARGAASASGVPARDRRASQRNQSPKKASASASLSSYGATPVSLLTWLTRL
mmetsp:Transcript_44588/g.104160  ORF Transcript_44588/g.104160 Transcript_44588/m.104160 type:complete len:208 (+) Transcript_44588:190-813(+)